VTRQVVLALGSNLGDRLAHLQGAVDLLGERLDVTAVSPVYETDPVGGPDQADYLNAVLLADSDLPADQLLHLAHEVEAAHDRERVVRWGPRTLDVDLVAVGTERRSASDLELPHPRAHERAFVLVPWRDVAPDAELPGHGLVGSLVTAVDVTGVRRRADLSLRLPERRP
jgi:2-amino-4-hydroxy-6-hydroxymethyldihydropteridine diphosphokinase